MLTSESSNIIFFLTEWNAIIYRKETRFFFLNTRYPDIVLQKISRGGNGSASVKIAEKLFLKLCNIRRLKK